MSPPPFHLVQFQFLPMPTGRRVRDAVELLEAVQQMPDSMLARHLVLCTLDVNFDPARHRNDFAHWAAESLQEPALAEALSVVEPYRRASWDSVRQELEEILEDPRWSHGAAARARQDLFLEDAAEIRVETEVAAHDLDSMYELIAGADHGSLLHHVHGAALRHPAGRDDFAFWIDTALGLPEVADRLSAIDFPFYSLEELKRELLATLDVERRRLAETAG